jgi:hypothetical protein
VIFFPIQKQRSLKEMLTGSQREIYYKNGFINNNYNLICYKNTTKKLTLAESADILHVPKSSVSLNSQIIISFYGKIFSPNVFALPMSCDLLNNHTSIHARICWEFTRSGLQRKLPNSICKSHFQIKFLP